MQVAGRRTRAELRSVGLKTKSSATSLIPESVQRERERSEQGDKSQCNQTAAQAVWQPRPCLQFPPESTLEAVHAVHDPGNVEERQPDVLLRPKHTGVTQPSSDRTLLL